MVGTRTAAQCKGHWENTVKSNRTVRNRRQGWSKDDDKALVAAYHEHKDSDDYLARIEKDIVREKDSVRSRLRVLMQGLDNAKRKRREWSSEEEKALVAAYHKHKGCHDYLKRIEKDIGRTSGSVRSKLRGMKIIP